MDILKSHYFFIKLFLPNISNNVIIKLKLRNLIFLTLINLFKVTMDISNFIIKCEIE